MKDKNRDKETVRKQLIATLAAISVILVACNEQITTTPQSQKIPTKSPTPQLQPTAVSTPIPSFLATNFARMTARVPTETARAQNALADCRGYPYNKGVFLDRYYSPKRKWYATYCRYSDTGLDYTAIINTENSTRWEIPFYETWGIHQPEGIEHGALSVVTWSEREEFVFLEPYFCCLDGPGLLFSSGYGLFQVDLKSGATKQLDTGSSAYSLSPNGEQLALYSPESKKLVIKNLATNNAISFPFEIQFDSIGIFRWSHDGSKIVFSTASGDWINTSSGFAMYLIDINNRAIKRILKGYPDNHYAAKWLSDAEILVETYEQPNEYKFNIATNELTPIDSAALTLTPSP